MDFSKRFPVAENLSSIIDYRIKSSADKVSGATNYGSSISFTVNTDSLKSFIKTFHARRRHRA